MKNLIFKLFTMSFALLCGCSRNHDEESKVVDYHVKRDIGLTPSGDDLNGKFIRDLDIGLGLNSLEYGYDSIQIRVWFFYGGYRTNSDLIVLKNKNNDWNGVHCQFYIDNSSKSDTSIIVKSTTQKVSPPDWGNFMQKLFESNIKTLPDHFKLIDKGYGTDETHPGSVIIEYADKEIYRLYKYYSPASAYGDLKESQQVERIIKTISEELDVPELDERKLKNK